MSKYAKIILAITTIAFLMPSLWAQKKEKPFSYVSISGGLSIPFGDFADKVKGEDYTGYAMLGMGYKMRYGLPIGRKGFGINFGLSSTVNPMDAQAFAERLGESYPNSHIKMYTRPYVVTTLSGGLLITNPFSLSRFHMDFWVNLGIATGKFPTIDYQHVGEFDLRLISDKPNFGLASQYGIAGRYDITDQIGIMVEVEYNSSLLTYTDVRSPQSYSINQSFFQNQQRINVLAGIAFRVGGSKQKSLKEEKK